MKFALQLAVTTGRYLRLVIRAKLSLLLIIESIDSHIIYFSSQTLKKTKISFTHGSPETLLLQSAMLSFINAAKICWVLMKSIAVLCAVEKISDFVCFSPKYIFFLRTIDFPLSKFKI